ncbi:hypothetical protein V1522DRAFT_358253, partial [Lipomyces starkeyi]
ALEKDPQLRAKIESIKKEATQKVIDQTKPTDKEGKETTKSPPALSFTVSGVNWFRFVLDQQLLPPQ